MKAEKYERRYGREERWMEKRKNLLDGSWGEKRVRMIRGNLEEVRGKRIIRKKA